MASRSNQKIRSVKKQQQLIHVFFRPHDFSRLFSGYFHIYRFFFWCCCSAVVVVFTTNLLGQSVRGAYDEYEWLMPVIRTRHHHSAVSSFELIVTTEQQETFEYVRRMNKVIVLQL